MDRRELTQLFNFLISNINKLNPLRMEFVFSLKKQYSMTGVLTKREVESLEEIRDFIISGETAEVEEYQAQYSSFDYYGTTISANGD